jgi:protein phosphatase 2C family protein 2/3
MRIFFEDANFPQTSEVDNIFLEEVENSLRKAFHLADLALADDCSVNTSSGTTALTAFVFGRYILALKHGNIAMYMDSAFYLVKALFLGK